MEEDDKGQEGREGSSDAEADEGYEQDVVDTKGPAAVQSGVKGQSKRIGAPAYQNAQTDKESEVETWDER